MSKLVLGLNPGLTNADYHADKTHLSSSKLKLLLESTEKFKAELDNPPPPMAGAHLDLGTFVHSLIHEPDLVATEYAIFPGFRRFGAQYDAFLEANQGRKILSASMENTGRRLAASVQALPHALELLKGCESEQSIAVTLHDVPVKARFDAINVATGIILDTKTSRDPAGKDYFKETIKQYRYDLSAALYTAVASEYYQQQFEFYWLVISKTDVPESRLYKASQATMQRGTLDMIKALDRYKKCMASGIWLDNTAADVKQLQSTIEEI